MDRQDDLRAMVADYRARIASLQRRSEAEPASAQLQEDLARAHRSCAETLQSIVDASHDEGDRQAMLEQYRASLAIGERLVHADPDNAEWQRDLLIARKRVGDALRDRGDLAAALESYRAAVPIAERLAQAAQRHVRPQLDLFFVYAGMAMIEARLGEPGRALDAFHVGRAVMARLKAELPDDSNWPIYLDWIDAEIARLKG